MGFIDHGASEIDNRTLLADIVALGLKQFELVDHGGRLWSSQVAHCPRQGAIEATLKKSEQEITATSRFYIEIGNTSENLIIQSLANREKLLFAQYRLPTIKEYPGLELSGYVDAIALQDSQVRAVEIKTCGSLPLTPREDQKSQALIYSAVTGLPATMIYLSREVADWSGRLKIKQFDFSFNREELEFYIFNAIYARLCIEQNALPNRSTKISKKSHCFYCNHVDYCWNNGKLEKSSLQEIDLKSMVALTSKAIDITKRVMSPASILARRNGVLKHLSKHGTKMAKEYLGDNWPRLQF